MHKDWRHFPNEPLPCGQRPHASRFEVGMTRCTRMTDRESHNVGCPLRRDRAVRQTAARRWAGCDETTYRSTQPAATLAPAAQLLESLRDCAAGAAVPTATARPTRRSRGPPHVQ